MSGFFKRAKKKAKGLVDSLRPPSRQGRSPSPASPHTSRQSTPNLDINSPPTPPLQPQPTARLSPAVQSGSSTPPLELNAAQPVSSPTLVTPAYARPSTPPSALSTTGSVVYELLKTIGDASDMFLPLKAAVVGVLRIWDVCERTVQLNQEFLEHKEKLERLLKIISSYQGETELSGNLRERLEEIAAALQDLANAVQAKVDRGLASRVLQSDNDISEVKDLIDKMMSLIDVFEFEGGIRVEIGVEHVKNGVDDINRQLSEARQLQAVKEHEGYLERLRRDIATALDKHHVREAVYDAQQRSGCMEGTRIDVLDRVFRWITDPDAQPIFWLGGMAGTGKTAIAWSICERVQADGTLCLGGSFFCSRSTGSTAQRDVRCVIPTLAQLLARQSDEFAAALAAELKEEPDLAYKHVKVQVERLLLKPLAALSSSAKSVVFVIDALDECGDQPTATALSDNSETHAAVSEMLEALIDLSCSTASLPIKFIVISRPETHIRETSVSDIKVTSALHLHTIDKTKVTSDIQLYISETLSTAPANEAWFTTGDVKTLAERADGLFIFAATATKYILGGGKGLRAKRLVSVVSPLPATLAVAPLDHMYSSILMEASRSDIVEADDMQQMLKLVAAILSARMSLSVRTLAELLGLSTEYLRGCLDSLHAVVHLPEDDHDASLRTLHASFGDYLFTRAAAGIRITSTLGHDELAHGCLQRMVQDDFGFNISRSMSSFAPDHETKPDWISLSLRYACLHWAYHIQSASVQPALDDAVNKIFRPKFLFWLEVLSVLGEVGRASGLLLIAGSAVKLTEASRFLRDANSFVASSRAAIEFNVPHIYISALPFAPKESLVFQDFASFLTGVVSVETFGIDGHGGRLVMNLSGHQIFVQSVAYSPDGKLLASGSADDTVRIWDAHTGEETMPPLNSGDGTVYCVAFTTDGQRIVSCTEGGDIHLWDVRTGRAAMSPLHGHSGTVWSVAVSPDGRLIASASTDQSVRLWDAKTGQATAVLTGHESYVRSVVFSPDGNILASGSGDGTIRLWNTHTCEPHGQILHAVKGLLLSVAFSPDGSLLAVGSHYPHTIRVWNVSTGKEVGEVLEAECPVAGLVFAPDGSCIALTSPHGIRFWDWKTGQDVAPALGGHGDSVLAITYSPDGLYIATASQDRTILIWDAVHSQLMTNQLPSHKGSVSSVAVSADGSFIVSASADRTIRVWDSQSAEPTHQPFVGHKNEVLCVAVSADSRFIASGSADHTVRLWSTKTGEQIGEPLEGHEEQVNTVTFSHDVRWLASASSDKTVALWAFAGNQPPTLRQLRCDDAALSASFSSNSGLLAVVDSVGHVTVWELSTDGNYTDHMIMQASTEAVRSVCFSPDDCKIAAGSDDYNIYVWDVATKSLLQTLGGDVGGVYSIAYSPDGRLLVSGGYSCTIRIWDANTGHPIAALHGHDAAVRSIAFLPDGKSCVSSAEDGTIRSWDVVNGLYPLSWADHPRAGMIALDQADQADREDEGPVAAADREDEGPVAAADREDDVPVDTSYDPLMWMPQTSRIDILAAAGRELGWLVGPTLERLIWLPQEYRANILIGRDRTTLIATHHVVVSVGTVLHLDMMWSKCWRGPKSALAMDVWSTTQEPSKPIT